MRQSHQMAEMTSAELTGRLASGAPVILPTGTTEQHGPHLPLGVDFLLAQSIASDVAARLGAVVAPPVTYGYKSMPRSGGGPFFAGSVGLDGSTLSHLIRDVIRELARHGAERICVLDAHYENLWFLTEGIALAHREIGEVSAPRVVCLQHWNFLTEDVLAEVFPDGYAGIEFEHAAVLETSLMLHYHPTLVSQEATPDNPPAESGPYDVWPPHRDWVPESGSLVSARGASADKGRRLAEQTCRGIVAALSREFGQQT